jgi:hypothetical protein
VTDDANQSDAEKALPTDWAALRVEAAKLGISLSELQQRQRETNARRARKLQSGQIHKPTEKTET